MDYSTASSGLHSGIADDCIVMPSWAEVHLPTWDNAIKGIVAEKSSLFIPCLDVEVRLLDERLGRHPRVLAPTGKAIAAVGKPPTTIADLLGLGLPRSCREVDEPSVAAFLRSCQSGAWVKGQLYEANRVHTALEAARAGDQFAERWGTPWHLEEHVAGRECGLAFCAREGALMGAVLMKKLQLTTEGKTWSGEITSVPPDLLDRVKNLVRELDWTGAGEIEMIETWNGHLLLLELNPRFPAWIAGATVSGANLPLALIEGEPTAFGASEVRRFTRIVEEIPATQLGLPAFRWDGAGGSALAAKHPSGMPLLARRRSTSAALVTKDRTVQERELNETADYFAAFKPVPHAPTPIRMSSAEVFESRVAQVAAAASTVGFECAFSIKTAPDPKLMSIAQSAGMLADAITTDEYELALRHGFGADQCILNGPAKWWPEREGVDCLAFFADSVAELESIADRLAAGSRIKSRYVGIRLRSGLVPSRFGIEFQTSESARRTAELVHSLAAELKADWGVHFHHASSSIGIPRWVAAGSDVMRQAETVAQLLGRPPGLVDLGGGWHYDDLDQMCRSIDLVSRSAGWLCDPGSGLRQVIEPGKILVQATSLVATRVIGRADECGDLIVDATLGNVPETPFWHHPIAHWKDNRWSRIMPGRSRLLGRSCMEQDVLAIGIDLHSVRVGDLIGIAHTGAYDYSMSYPFGRGEASEL